MPSKLYLIGSLRNPRIPKLADRLRGKLGIEVFDDWYAAGPEADDHWKKYEQERGREYLEALEGYSASHVFGYDKSHLDSSSHCLLVLPAGKSGHMEVMYAQYAVGAKTAILLDEEDVRWDIMYKFIPTILRSDDEIADWVSHTGERNGQCRSGPAVGNYPLNPTYGEEVRQREAENGFAAYLRPIGSRRRVGVRRQEVRRP